MSARHPVARKARLGLDQKTTEVAIRPPQVRIVTIAGVRGVWVPLHPLAEVRRA